MSLILFMLAFAESPSSTPWRPLIESRMNRDSNVLNTPFWREGHAPVLALQEYLMTLGQNGDPDFADRIRVYWRHPTLQGSALFAYGELDGAPLKPLLAFQPHVSDENMPLFAEALVKLAGPADADQLVSVWSGFSEKVRNWALFYYWRLKSETLTRFVVEKLAGRLSEQDSGYVFYLFRSGTKIEPALLVRLLAFFEKDPQALIYATRLQANAPSPELRDRFANLCGHKDWRVRVNALNALAGQNSPALLQKEAMARLEDANPNVVRIAAGILAGLGKEDVDRRLVPFASTLSASQVQTLVTGAAPERYASFFRLIEPWEKSDNPWERGQWIRALGKTRSQKYEDRLQSLLMGRPWETGSPGEQVLALTALAKRNPELLTRLAPEILKRGDGYLNAAIVRAYDELGQTTALPFMAAELELLASRLYVSTDFHDSFFAFFPKLASDEAWRAAREKLLKHPDYLVRLKAMSAEPMPDLETRRAVFAKPWSHQIEARIWDRSIEMITGADRWHWRIETAKGVILIELKTAYAPITCANILSLSESDYWDGMPIHRVAPNFVVQAGDNRGDGSGGPGYSIPCEVNPLRYRKGSVGMALAGKDTGGAQFFICHSDQPHLDGGYTIFGEVTRGMQVVDMLEEGNRILDSRVVRIP